MLYVQFDCCENVMEYERISSCYTLITFVQCIAVVTTVGSTSDYRMFQKLGYSITENPNSDTTYCLDFFNKMIAGPGNGPFGFGI